MKLTQIDQEIYDELLKLWTNTDPERPDMERGKELLDHMLFDDGGASVWYIVPPTGVFIITNIVAGMGANITPVALYTVDAETALAELRSVMREFDLRRITAVVPSPVHAVTKNLDQIGFELEGVMVDGTLYDSLYTNVSIFGLLRRTVEADKPTPIAGPAAKDVGKKRRRRRRRSRRKAKGNHAEGRRVQEQSSSQRVEERKEKAR